MSAPRSPLATPYTRLADGDSAVRSSRWPLLATAAALLPAALLVSFRAHGRREVEPYATADGAVETDGELCANGFPRHFVWGLGTAAYQIEGAAGEAGRQPSIWDNFSHSPGKVHNGDTGDVACDHFHRVRSDVELMRSIGLRHYRFSISWSRAMSWDGATRTMVPNEAGLAWYDRLLVALAAAGIEPYVTLYHWDLPLALHDELGGWHTPGNAALVAEFARYAALCFDRFGARVRFWVTFNEPWSFAVEGYDSGKSAPGCAPFQPGPGRCAGGATTVYEVAHNVLNAHAAAVQRFRRRGGGGGAAGAARGATISMTLNCDFSFPASGKAADAAAAERANEFFLGWWLQPLLTGDYPAVMRQRLGARLPRFTPAQAAALAGSIDVLALNHYSSHLVSDASDQGDAFSSGWCAWADDQRLTSSYGATWPVSESPWLHAYPPGLRALLRWAAGPASARWRGPVYITENGWSCHSMSAAAAAADSDQVRYLEGYTAQLRLAMAEDGIDVRGYFGWSLLDNFEWSDGYSKRFGVFYVDYASQRRTPKLAARWWNRTRRC